MKSNDEFGFNEVKINLRDDMAFTNVALILDRPEVIKRIQSLRMRIGLTKPLPYRKSILNPMIQHPNGRYKKSTPTGLDYLDDLDIIRKGNRSSTMLPNTIMFGVSEVIDGLISDYSLPKSIDVLLYKAIVHNEIREDDYSTVRAWIHTPEHTLVYRDYIGDSPTLLVEVGEWTTRENYIKLWESQVQPLIQELPGYKLSRHPLKFSTKNTIRDARKWYWLRQKGLKPLDIVLKTRRLSKKRYKALLQDDSSEAQQVNNMVLEVRRKIREYKKCLV